MNVNYFACKEHVELAMDHIIDELETAPIIEVVEKEAQLSTTCSFCEQVALYKVVAST